ncbi:unnamed protein product, partial [Pocillopora meandrina]
MAASALGISAPNLSCSAGAEDVFDGEMRLQKINFMMPYLPLTQSRSRRPLSVDDCVVAEEYLTKSPHSWDSGVFSPLSLSSSSLSSSDQTWMSPPPSSRLTSSPKPKAKKQLFSFPAALYQDVFSDPSMESIFGDIHEDIGVSWKILGRYMLKRECILNNIDEDYKGVGEKAYQFLLKWKAEVGEAATPQKLFLSVLHIKRTDVAKKLMTLVPSLQGLSDLVIDSAITSESILYNWKEEPENLKVERVLSEDKKVLVCLSTVTSQRLVLKQEEGEVEAYAVRKCIDCQVLRKQSQRLRKTEEFLKDLEMKQKMIQNLLAVIKQLQNHLLNQHQYISGQKFSCQNCELYTLKQDLVQKELTLLHYELERMSQTRNRRISISGIPSERIFNLATRTYSVCEEHQEMHLDSKRRQSMCQHSEETMDSDDNDHIEGPLMCALNVIIGIGRRRKVTQSLKSKKTTSGAKKKLGKANSNPISSSSSLSSSSSSSSRQSYLLAQENPIFMPSFVHSLDWSGVPAFKVSWC